MINQASFNDALHLSAMSPWEIAMMESKNRVSFKLLPLTPQIAIESCHLEHFHGDPVDRIIVATARVANLTLATRDKKILSYAHTSKVNIFSA